MRRALVLLALLATACAGGRTVQRSPLIGQRAELAAEDLAGREVRVPADSAGKVRIIDFWASWCEPCREQLPLLDRLARDYGSRGLAVYGVAFDEDRAMVEAFLSATPVSFPILWDRGGGRLSAPFSISRLPTTLLVDRAGVVRFVHLGYDVAEGRKLEGEVRELLGE
ncbi:TlpA disulfide reductase family protein [Anaeromyxobacter sp. SG64]|uniref:TlpA family protein disulfide reductase n=1 Tax=Anaeromyxobacter sp. SG64 TaxID=2925409 RepID=UPI001F585CE5|nr:TlpA disulfide reductase family protein [Anaeromyxobacter sp. SG64]